jgi:hypothetical protein
MAMFTSLGKLSVNEEKKHDTKIAFGGRIKALKIS